MAKKKKGDSWGWKLASFAAVAVGGAVVGAYGLRMVDRYFIDKYGRAPFTGSGTGDGTGEGGGELVEANPRVQPSAIAPVIPFFGMQPQVMPPPVLHVAGSGFSAAPSSIQHAEEIEPVRGNPRRKTAKELKADREAEFEALVSRFETGEIG